MGAAGVGVIISHYPQGRGLCSPVTPGFIELATLQCLLPAGKITQHTFSQQNALSTTCCPDENISLKIHRVQTV